VLNKVAFFVEGYTEQLFIENLLREVFGSKNIAIEIKSIEGGARRPIKISSLSTPTISADLGYYILIYDCGGEGLIKSYISDQRKSLIKAGYSKIIGVRDVFPNFTRAEISQLIYGLYFKLPQKPLPIIFVLSIMEVESWFIAEETHFQKIDARLTTNFINTNYSLDPSTYNTELLLNPALDLHKIYKLVNKAYSNKKKSRIARTVNNLDYSNIYFTVKDRIRSLNQLVTEIDGIF
jgi:hypothetical protein